MMTQRSYVKQREDELLADFKAKQWWLSFMRVLGEIGLCVSWQQEANYYLDRIQGIRSLYIKRGRKAGGAS